MANRGRASRRPTIASPSAPVIVGGDETVDEREERMAIAHQERVSQFKYDNSIEAQKADALLDIEEGIARGQANADEANAGRDTIAESIDPASTTDIGENFIPGTPVAAAEGEAYVEGTDYDSFVNLAGDGRMPGEGEPYDGYNTISGTVSDVPGQSYTGAVPLRVNTIVESVCAYELRASRGRFTEFDSSSRWPLTTACGLVSNVIYSDNPPKRWSVTVQIPTHGEKVAAVLPNKATADAYLADLEALMTEV